MSLLGPILFLLLFAALFLFSLAANIISLFVNACKDIMRALGLGGKEQPRQQTYSNTHTNQTSQRPNPASNGKIFGDDEGEYVDFEEIKP